MRKIRIKTFDKWILGGFPVDFLLAVAVAILLAIRPMTWGFKLALLVVLIAIAAELAWRLPLSQRKKAIAALLAVIAAAAIGYGPVEDQYNIDAVLRDYKAQRDLVAQYENHDENLKKVVTQYDRLRNANSLFRSWYGKVFQDQETSIDAKNIEDMKIVLNNLHAVTTPFGDALAIKLGLNMYRLILAVPMRATHNIYFSTHSAPGSHYQIIENSNLGFTILWLPLSQPVDIFGHPISN